MSAHHTSTSNLHAATMGASAACTGQSPTCVGQAPLSRRAFVGIAGLTAAAGLAGMTGPALATESAETAASATVAADTSSLKIDSAAWSYDSDNDVYYQIGVPYCTNPQADAYESMGIYVPGAYFDATGNGDGTYTCTVSETGSAGIFTAKTAPIVIPVNTAGYSAQAAPTSYSGSGLTTYLERGLVYVFAGCRGRANGTNSDGSAFAGGAPWGCTDLKAAIRCLRYNADVLPGDPAKVVTFGMSGGGAQSALMGATGDSSLYEPYLREIGAAMTDDAGSELSDAVFGSMCWCPITELDVADEAYEWMMGQFSTSGTRASDTFTSVLSQDLAASFADWVNQAGIERDGLALTLEQGGEGIYTSGTYYEAVLELIESSLNNFLQDTTFPYTPSNSFNADGGFAGGGTTDGMGGNGIQGSGPSDDGDLPDMGGELSDDTVLGGGIQGRGLLEDGDLPDLGGELTGDAVLGGTGDAVLDGTGDAVLGGLSNGMGRDGMGKGGMDLGSGSESSSGSTTYETAQDYIAMLNADEDWVTYDADSNTATVTSVGAFVRACKTPSKTVGAFDALDRSQGENELFGTSAQDSAHFDPIMADLLAANADTYAQLAGWDASYPADYEADLALTDDQGVDMATRANAYNPLYYLLESAGGKGSSTPAAHWRIRTGIEQGDTSVTTEMNLVLALEADERVSDVDFETVWGLGHTMAERTGSSTENFLTWLEQIV